MEVLKVILLAVGLMSLAMVGMAITILLKKGGKFPNTHVSGNKYLKQQGVYCSQTQDKLAQREGWKKVNFKKVSFISDSKVAK
jgi:hypothetical protein